MNKKMELLYLASDLALVSSRPDPSISEPSAVLVVLARQKPVQRAVS
jgi:hypothetical protein